MLPEAGFAKFPSHLASTRDATLNSYRVLKYLAWRETVHSRYHGDDSIEHHFSCQAFELGSVCRSHRWDSAKLSLSSRNRAGALHLAQFIQH